MRHAWPRRKQTGASAEGRAMLRPERGPIAPPIRADIFGAARFAQHGRSLGEAHEARVVNTRRPTAFFASLRAPFFPRLRENIAVLREAHRYIGLQERAGHHVSPAGEWLLDNFHIVLAQIKEIHDGLPRRYFLDLPVLVEAHLAGLPRVYGIAWAFIAHTDSAFDEGLLVTFLDAYQQTRELTLGELWALPTTLRVVLIENLRRLSERVAAAKAARELANLWCDDLLAASQSRAPRTPPLNAQPLFDMMRTRGVERAFALQVMQRLRADLSSRALKPANGREVSLKAVQAILTEVLPDPSAAQMQEQTEQAADNLSVSNAITSLRLLGDAEWRGLVERTSALMQLMQTSPTYRAERDDTQDTTLHAIECLARRSGRSELAVAGTLLALMQSRPDLRATAPGTALSPLPSSSSSSSATGATIPTGESPYEAPSYWLRGAGCTVLRRGIGLPAAWLPGWADLRQRSVLPAYLLAMSLGSVALTTWFVQRFAAPDAPWPAWLLLALLTLLPASEAVIALVNRMISESVPPRRLARLALTGGIPPEHRVLVVVPTMLNSAAGVDALARQLERHYLANNEPHAQFALLSDYTDADAAHRADDTALLAHAVAALDALEARHAPAASASDAPRRFLLLHRERSWSDTEQRWIGWERKRGKLEQLIALLAGQGPSPFIDLGDCSRPAVGTPYVVTLDSDTVLPPGALRALVGVAAHPLNRPRVDAARRRVVAGHGILQPRITTPLPAPDEVTPFHWLFAGQCGVDPYSAATSEVYQDLFEEGTFIGKGLLQVQAMHAVLGGRLPAGQVLSHDLIEGALARCGGVSDVTLIEDAPMHAEVAASRVHRWTRGDWQLVPLLRRANGLHLRAIDRWKMLDNLRRSLVAPLSVALLVAALCGLAAPWAALALVALAFGGGPMLGAIAGLLPSRDDLAWGHFCRQAVIEMARAAGGALWNLALLLQHARSLVHAMGTAIWRMAYSHRGLLQWTTSASAEGTARHDPSGFVRRHADVSLAAAALLAGLLWAGTPTPLPAVLICLAWAASPAWLWWASRPGRHPRTVALNAVDRAYLLGLARDTWRLFERYVGPESHHLPPDNVQTTPGLMVAPRTSPTNIGLYLLSIACARRFGWIGTGELLTRCELTLATLAGLPRHRGHFLNWYDTQTLAALHPAYVSAVDSGNLCGHLVTLAAACEELIAELDPAAAADAHADTTLRLRAVAAHCRQLAEAAEFGFLYDARRRLLHIGYRVAEQQLDTSYYDLLASEARLASLWAIAKGDVPVGHWGALGRPFFAVKRDVGLRSWAGSMFEYLMPTLVLNEPAGSALASAARAAVHEHIACAHALEVPWGMSESAYAASDHTLAYQYAPHGAPQLALRRTPVDDVVVAPYASALAALFEPCAAVDNLRRLERLHARGELGFLEAVDFSAERQTAGSRYTLVSTFMAHHQGMTIVALANVLLGGAPQRWGMGDPHLGAVASLLQERMPREVSRLSDPPLAASRGDRREAVPGPAREMVPGENALQPTHLLSNGRYSVALRANGAGWSRLHAADVSRWRDDALRDAYGTFIYLRRQAFETPVSITQRPAPDAQASYQTTFHADRVCLDAEWPDLRTRCTVWVSPEDDIELRRVELWNTSSKPIDIELMSMFEVALSEARADEAHPAFANLFISADWDAAERALYFARKPRLPSEDGLHAVHFVAQADDHLIAVQAQTDRARWLGRNRDASHPLAHGGAHPLGSGPRATGLDPVAALTLHLTLPAYGSAHVTLGTAAAGGSEARVALRTLVDRYRQATMVDRSSLMSATFASIRLHEMRIGSEDRAAMQTLATALILLLTRPAPTSGEGWPDTERQPHFDRRSLWRLGVSGDRPLIVVHINAEHGLRLVRSLLQALRWWSWGGLLCDLVIVSAEPRSYLMPVQLELAAYRERYASDMQAFAPARSCGLCVLQAEDLSAAESATLMALARAHMHADGRPLAYHMQELTDWHDAALDARIEQAGVTIGVPSWVATTRAARGEFDGDGGFHFSVTSQRRPARPWINVLANAAFGAQISEAGSGYTWGGNSRMNQLTPWSNDPVSDPSGEAFFVQDLRTRQAWSVGAGCGHADARYAVTHGQGWSKIRHQRGDLAVTATWCVDPVQAVKQVRIALQNHGTRTLRLRVVGVVEWLMGAQRSDRQSVRLARESLTPTGLHPSHADVLLATQCDGHAGFGGGTAFLAMQREGWRDALLPDWTCDRRELFDARGRRVIPDHLGQHAGTGLDPCAAAAATLTLAPGETSACVFLLGYGETLVEARALAHAAVEVDALQREQAVRTHWNELLGTVTVHTLDPLFDALVNRWLLYQTLACRLWARAGFYQAGGAFGFRDQLQDTLALVVSAPDLARRQLLLAASRQFVEGDVQHWWHAPTGAGVRTHCSDDLLWLPHAVEHYVRVSGDAGVLDARVPFLEGQAIAVGAEDAYFVPQISAHSDTLYEHCARAIDRSLAVGAHGLPLMGSGDWNDGMNRVGHEGRGESVWLGWFLCRLVADFAPLALARHDTERAQRWQAAAVGWRAALTTTAWDGQWFVRAYFDDGSPLGTHDHAECRIDLIAQAWAVLSGVATPTQQRTAMASAARLLMNSGLVRLLDPPLAQASPSAGYIQGYPPGVRENGGQYSHAGVWALMAQAALGDADRAYATFTHLSPAHRSAPSATPVAPPASPPGAHAVDPAAAYELEPYVMAGDVYTQPPYVGRGGWSWYTGSAAWMHRAAIESICGMRVQGQRVCFEPHLPAHWPSLTLNLRRAGAVHEFVVCADWATPDIDQARARGAVSLAPGEWLNLDSAALGRCHLVTIVSA